MTGTALISIIMPAYNAEKYIAESIESVRRQTYTNWELLVVDDGSVDNTASIVKQLASSDNRIKYIYQENGRQGKARNNGLLNAQGEYIAFLDADDLWVPEKLSKQIESIVALKVDLVFSGFYTFENEPSVHRRQDNYHGYYQGQQGLEKFLKSNYIPILTALVKRDAVERVNFFSENPDVQNGEDYHLWLKLLAAGYAFWGADEYLAYYRLHTASATASDRMVIFPMLASLKELAMEYPQKEELIKKYFVLRINKHLQQNNVNSWKLVERLLDMKKSITLINKSYRPEKLVYTIFGKRVFRYFWILHSKIFSTQASVNGNLDNLVFSAK